MSHGDVARAEAFPPPPPEVVAKGLPARLAWNFRVRARAERAQILRRHFKLQPADRVLDLGGGDGSHFQSIFPLHKNVVIADVDHESLHQASVRYGYETVALVPDVSVLPFATKEFDFAFCSSVIEHCTGPKDRMPVERNGRVFKEYACRHQRIMAAEINRISRSYFVQTPYKFFPIESHSLLPGFIVLLPRRAFAGLFWFCRNIGLDHYIPTPDFQLISIRHMRQLFPDAEIKYERLGGFIKSLIAIKT